MNMKVESLKVVNQKTNFLAKQRQRKTWLKQSKTKKTNENVSKICEICEILCKICNKKFLDFATFFFSIFLLEM